MNAMTRRLITALIILLGHYDLPVRAQDREALLLSSRTGRPDSVRLGALVKLAGIYLDRPGEYRGDLDSAEHFITALQVQSDLLHQSGFSRQASYYRACLALQQKDYELARKLFAKTATLYQSVGDHQLAAKCWTTLAEWMFNAGPAYQNTVRRSYLQAYQLLYASGTQPAAAEALLTLANSDMNAGNLKEARQEAGLAVLQYRRFQPLKLYHVYYLQAEILYRLNEVQNSLLARLECLRSFEQDPNGKFEDGARYAHGLAVAYFNDLQYEPSLRYYRYALELCEKNNWDYYYHNCVRGAALCFARLKRYQEGLSFLKAHSHRFLPRSAVDDRLILSMEIQLNAALDRDNEVERLIPRFNRISEKVLADMYTDNEYYKVDNFIAVTDPLMHYYAKKRQWQKFKGSYSKLDRLPKDNWSVLIRRRMLNYGYKIDSLEGHLLTALQKYQRIISINDSVTDANTKRHIQELETKYNSFAKDRTIQDLNGRTAVQNAKIREQSVKLYASIAGIILLAIVCLVIYYALRHKQKANAELSNKQLLINEQNRLLSELLQEKDDLLDEKEWLVREIHHRVKNNLQIVLSLLYNQSDKLENEAAKKALRSVQDQIQSIAIIHQKLYSRSEMNTVTLSEYIEELIVYLSNVYAANLRRVRFRLELEPLALIPAQIVPLGLIINEAVTNAIKYAFDDTGGEITIKTTRSGEETITLSIADNGKGFDKANNHSGTLLGIEMMEVLARQINGTFEQRDHYGAMVSITFQTVDPQVTQSG